MEPEAAVTAVARLLYWILLGIFFFAVVHGFRTIIAGLERIWRDGPG